MSQIQLDLNNPVFLQHLFALGKDERHILIDTLEKLSRLDWQMLYRSAGFKWELISSVTGPQGQRIYSLRASQKMRVLAWREGDILRLLSIHPDHDSAYRVP